MRQKKLPIVRYIFAFAGILIDLVLAYQAFFPKDISVVNKIIFLSLLELTLPVNIFIAFSVFVGQEKSLSIFFKHSNSKMLWLLIFVNFDFVVISTIFGIIISPFLFICLIFPILYFMLFVLLWRYCNFDSERLSAKITNKYLGVAVDNHFVYDGVDVLSEKNCKQVENKNVIMQNPFNTKCLFDSEKMFYVTGKDYKFYIATYPMDQKFTLIFLARNKDVLRTILNKHKKEDFELNKNIYLACGDIEEKKNDDFVYVEDKLRYKISNLSSKKSNVQIEQKTMLPHLTSQNKIATWFGDTFTFENRAEADNFVKFVVEETKKGFLDGEI